jgi:hypothetical protein
MKKFVVPALLAAGVLAMTGCRKDPLNDLTGDEARIYITKHSDSVNFSSYQTFSIADSVAVIDNNQYAGKTLNETDAAYVSAVRTALTQRGYTEVGREANPDLGINISRVYNTSTGLFDYGSYWDPYYGSYWDPFYWGYPGYGYNFPSFYYGSYSITEGALSIDIFDLKNAANTKQISAIWSGLIRGTGAFSRANAAGGVQTLFEQSQYFKATF